MSMDDVFRALADPSRRRLLDALYRSDGQTLGELEGRLPMTRFGVMKHLRLLEDAGLIVTRRDGREKLHFLNAVPIQRIQERWVSKYTESWAVALTDLKRNLENEMIEKVYEVYIRTTPERLWQAIVDPDLRRRYNFGVVVDSTWSEGSEYVGIAGDDTVSPGKLIFEGENLEVDPPRRLVQSYRALWNDAALNEGTTRVTWEIEPVGDSCRLTITHDRLRPDANPQLFGGWPMVLSGLKTLLETGEELTTPASLQYRGASPVRAAKPARSGH